MHAVPTKTRHKVWFCVWLAWSGGFWYRASSDPVAMGEGTQD